MGNRNSIPADLCGPTQETASSFSRSVLTRLKKDVRGKRLAPFYEPLEDAKPGVGGEECLICYCVFPSLNSSACCSKPVCSECYLQVIKSQLALRGKIPCPFCMKPSFSIYFRGPKSAEEKHREKVAEQKVFEAQIKAKRNQDKLREEAILIINTSASSTSPESSVSNSDELGAEAGPSPTTLEDGGGPGALELREVPVILTTPSTSIPVPGGPPRIVDSSGESSVASSVPSRRAVPRSPSLTRSPLGQTAVPGHLPMSPPDLGTSPALSRARTNSDVDIYFARARALARSSSSVHGEGALTSEERYLAAVERAASPRSTNTTPRRPSSSQSSSSLSISRSVGGPPRRRATVAVVPNENLVSTSPLPASSADADWLMAPATPSQTRLSSRRNTTGGTIPQRDANVGAAPGGGAAPQSIDRLNELMLAVALRESNGGGAATAAEQVEIATLLSSLHG